MNTYSYYRSSRAPITAAAVLLTCAHAGCLAQTQPVERAPPVVPSTGSEQQPSAQIVQSARPGALRKLFVGTLAAVVEGVGAGLTSGLTQGVNGAIVNWFGKSKSQDLALPQYAQTAADPYGAQAQYPTSAGATSDGYAGSVTQDSQAVAPVDVASAPGVYAGIAYELHTIGQGGMSMPVDPVSYTFSTGERFVVHYRPTLPGRITVHNMNPIGQETRIDSVDVAAGELVTLGPYEFTRYKGDETLRLQLTPCRTDALIVETRDIVKANDAVQGEGLQLAHCDVIATRSAGLGTRDIVKVGVEGGTSFAFDPATPQELASGQFAPRELTIILRHR